MPDEIDAATDHIERTMAATLQAQRNKPDTMPPCGKCYNCGDDIDAGLKFCNADCVADFEYREKRKS